MAKIIPKSGNQCDDKMLNSISWKDYFQIYSHSAVIFICICVVNLFKLLKYFFDTRVKQNIMKQFWMLSSNRDNNFDRRLIVKRRVKNIVSPLTLTSRLGAHKYIRINVGSHRKSLCKY